MKKHTKIESDEKVAEKSGKKIHKNSVGLMLIFEGLTDIILLSSCLLVLVIFRLFLSLGGRSSLQEMSLES